MSPRIFLAPLLLGIGLTVAGCGGGDEHPRHHNREAMGGGVPAAPREVMHGTQSFFAGKIVVEARLTEGGGRHGGPAGPGAGGPSEGDDQNGDEGGGGGRHHGHRGGGGGRGYLGGGGGMGESNLPPVTLRLHITNTSDAPIEITFNGCDSALGNFVVVPEKMTVAAGQSIEPDPMRSLLGIPADEVPLELALAMPGKSVKKMVTLRLAQPAPTMNEAPGATAPAPAPPPSVP